MVIRSKKQRMNYKIYMLLMEWLNDILPDNDLTASEKLSKLPSDKYITRMNQTMLSAFTFRWVKQKIKKVLKRNKNKKIEDVTLKDITNVG
jgi:hypothetical protein